MNRIYLILLVLLPLSVLHSQVTINVPGDYSTIQAAINSANNGDLVLVADGTYYENINFMGKAITVASYFIQDSNKSHITNTIINGSQPSNPDTGSVVIFINGEDTTSVLCGFTITGGSGTLHSGLNYRLGGGILVLFSGAKICHNIITSNTIDNSTTYTLCIGGGICVISQGYNCIISNNEITDNTIENSSAVGGGISLYLTGPTWISCNKITGNVINCTGGSGGGIDIWNPYNDVYVRNNIIRGNQSLTNNYGGGGIDIYNTSTPLFVSNNLIAENTGFQGGGILVENPTEGDYSVENNFKLNNDSFGEIAGVNNHLFSLNKLLIESVIENNTIVENSAANYCGGIICFNSSPEIINSIVWGNIGNGAQIYNAGLVEYSDVEGGYTGQGNINLDPMFAAGSEYYFLDPGSPCIDAGNPDPLYNDVEDPLNPGTPMEPAYGTLRNDMGHSGGPNSLWCYGIWPVPVELSSFTAILQGGKVDLYWTTATETNNLGFEIQRKITDNQNNGEWQKIAFVNGYGTTTQEQQYFYQDNISNINASVLIYRLKQIDLDGGSTYSEEVLVELSTPADYTLHQNFPNPFNPSTTISYSLPLKSQVDLTVYNALGEKVLKLVDEVKEAGRYNVEFNSSGLSSGVYFYRIKAGDFIQVRKMMLLK